MAAQEQKKSYAVIKNFKGINTKANRTAIEDSEFSWLENAMPIGAGNIKVLQSQSQVYLASNVAVTWSNTIVSLWSVNLNNQDYVLASEANGALEYFNITAGTQGNVAAAGTFSSSGVKVSQYKSDRVIIGDPSKGLYNWNGGSNAVVAVGSVGTLSVVNGGSGYLTAPLVTISAPNDSNGVQATALAFITAGAGTVIDTKITNDGSLYDSLPTVTFSVPETVGGVRATAYAVLTSGKVDQIIITNPGNGYLSVPTITITANHNGSGAAATAVLGNGSVTALSVTNAGSGYTSPPTVTFTSSTGANATALAQLLTFKTGTVAVLVNTGGSGYSNASNVVVSFSGGGGSAAAATAILSGNVVSQVVMTNPGTGYTSAPTVTITGGGATVNATATAYATTDTITDVATFSGRVWVASGRNMFYSAAGSYSDFTSVSAGSLTLSDTTLHSNIKSLLSANNFLYIFGEDSINVFSDVRVGTTGATLFTNTNVSASVGSPIGGIAFAYFRNVLFMNNYGVYALIGSTTNKISDPLDGIFPLIDFTQPVTSGQVMLNNILCAAFSFTYVDSVLGSRPVQAIFFDKKWFLSSQGSVAYTTSVPAGGAVNLYGNIGLNLYKLYNTSANTISVKVQTALMPLGDAIRTKQALKFAVEATLSGAATMNVTVDSERASSPTYALQNSVTWVTG